VGEAVAPLIAVSGQMLTIARLGERCMIGATMIWPTIVYATTVAIFAGIAISQMWHMRWVRRLPRLDQLDRALKNIGCTIVVAAPDEEARIENTIRHLLAQKHIDFEVIVVDDRSQDRTPEILRRLASEDARLQVKRIDTLPEGWLGKCYACHVGASAATRDWILFTDADCWLKPDVIVRAAIVAEGAGADHITLTPGTVVESLWTRSWHLMFLVTLLGWISGVNRDRPAAHIGIGAFNLVRASAYKEFGGYEALRLTVLDDIKMGLLVRRIGKKTRAFLAVDAVECHWGTTVRSMIKVMEKNYFAAIGFRLSVVIVGVLFLLLFVGIVISGFVSGTAIGIIAGFSPLFFVIPAAAVARKLNWPWTAALGTPFMLLVFWYALVNSTFVTLRQGGVRWRDTFYSLETLRAGMVR